MRALAILVVFFVSCGAAATAETERNNDPAQDQAQHAAIAAKKDATMMRLTFNTPQSIAPWRAVNDGVMGGLSSGGPVFDPTSGAEGALVFAGIINTNGGGFSSIRHPMTPGALSGAEGIGLRVKSDGRAYRLTFRTSQRWRGRSVSWQIPIPRTEPGEWAEVTAFFANADASIFGRRVNAGRFDPLDVREIGIILADGRDGAFRLDVAEMASAP